MMTRNALNNAADGMDATARNNERLRILHQIDKALLASEEPAAIAAAALPPLRELLGVPRAIVNLFDLARGEVQWLAAAGRRRVRTGDIRYSIRLMGDVDALHRGEPQFIDVYALPPGPDVDALLASGVNAYAVVPMIAEGELIGALSFGGENGDFSTDQLEIAQEAAAQFSLALLHARLHERVKRQAEELRSAFEDTNVATVLTDINNRFIRVNAAFVRMFGYTWDETLNKSMADITHPGDVAESLAQRERLLAGEVSHFQLQKRYIHKEGRLLWGLTNVTLVRDENGTPSHYVGQVQDVTERKLLEEQLQQSQKMEAIGRLAGGVAHDFNNLLTVILGYSDIALQQLGPENPLHDALDQIKQSGERASHLTRQLLAFSRRQVLEPTVLDVNERLHDMEKMLRRLIGEDVELTFRPFPELWQIKADAGQFEQVVMNLAVNARDAMPTGGKLTIETSNFEIDSTYVAMHAEARVGEHVMIAVTDTGCGMDASTKARIFEPFFTTKDPDKGTGLGLATVFGIVKQSSGHIEVYSEVGVGTAFKLCLPRVFESPSQYKPKSDHSTAPRGTETLLLAEDEDGVRSLATLVLQSHGYTVLPARSGIEALAMCEKHQDPIHMLVTDVVMPNLSGRLTAERLLKIRPDMKVLYLSGYADDAIVRHGILESEMPFLQKPFTGNMLVRKVRNVLDQ